MGETLFPITRIEDFAARIEMILEQLLIVDITETLSRITFHTRASLLLRDVEFSIGMKTLRKNRDSKQPHYVLETSVGPWFLTALAASQYIAIVSDVSQGFRPK